MGEDQLLYAPVSSPGVEILLSYEHARRDRFGTPTRDIGSDDFDLTNFTNAGSEVRLNQDILSLRASFELDENWTIEGQVSYQDLKTRIPATNAFFDLTQSFENIQGELLARYTGDGFIRAGVIGVAIEDQDEFGINDTLDPFGFPFVFVADGSITNKSIFGEVEFALTDQLFAFAGGRYEEQDIRRDVDLTFFSISQAGVSNTEDSRFTPRLGLRYEATEALVLGYQYSEGFRPGSVDVNLLPPVPGVNVFDGETLRQHEAWARYQDPADRFGLNVTAFYYELDDAQVAGAGGGRLIANLPRAEGYGIEIAGNFRLAEHLRAFASVGFVETEITDVGTAPGGAAFLGGELPEAVGQTYSIGLQYAPPSGFSIGASLQHVADRAGFAGSTPLPNYTKLDVRAGYATELWGNDFKVEAFVENALNDDIIVSTDPNLAALNAEFVGAPLTVGVAATLRF